MKSLQPLKLQKNASFSTCFFLQFHWFRQTQIFLLLHWFIKPSYFHLQVSLDEGTPPNMKVVQVNATDADAGVNADITYSLTLAPSSDFYIDSKTGK